MKQNELNALAERAEQATAEQQKDVLIDAYEVLAKARLVDFNLAARFLRFIDAEAYESAAMSLVPEGLAKQFLVSERYGAEVYLYAEGLEPFGGCPLAKGRATTPALALTAAALRSRAHRGMVDEPCAACGGGGRMGPFFPGGLSTICGNCSPGPDTSDE